MKTKEFIRRVEDELGYITVKSENYINIRKEGGKFSKLFAMVDFNKVLSIDTSFHNFTSLDKHEQDLLFNLILDYASTPLEEREEEKKYIYSFPFHITARNVETKHICRNHTFRESGESDDLIIDLSPMDTVVTNEKFFFTDKEVEKYTGKDKALFNVCEKIEVTP